MKNIRYQGLLIALCLSAIACNKTEEEFFKKKSFLIGIDVQCSSALDEAGCKESIGCQPAYGEPAEGQEKGEYSACILNPDPESDGGSSGGEESSGGSSSGGEETSGSSSGGEESAGTSGGEETSGSSSGGEESAGTSGGEETSGSSSGGKEAGGSSTGGSNDDEDPVSEDQKGNCKGIDSKNLLIRKEIEKKDGSFKIIAKAKVCHNSKNDSHSIIIACPAVKAHVKNHGDYLGACKVE